MDLNLSESSSSWSTPRRPLRQGVLHRAGGRAAEASGHDPALWRRLREGGWRWRSRAVGGMGCLACDLGLVAEQHGRHLGSAPLIEAQAAARLLARVGRRRGPPEVLARVLSGDALVTLALHPPRNGILGLVPAGAVADAVVFLDGDRLLPRPVGRAGTVATLGSLPVADVPMAAGTVELAVGRRRRGGLSIRPVDEWMILMAVRWSASARGHRDRGRVRQGAQGLRGPDRFVPGRRPRAGRRRHGGRGGPAAGP